MNHANADLLWWVVPGVLAGMPMPFVHPDRRLSGGGPLNAFADELPVLYDAGIRGVVSLLNMPADASVYEAAGFGFLWLPTPDGAAPTVEQAYAFIAFVNAHKSAKDAVAVHCEAGCGRTGTIIAAYLIAEGLSAAAAIQRVRDCESCAVETRRQIVFLERFAEGILNKTDSPEL